MKINFTVFRHIYGVFFLGILSICLFLAGKSLLAQHVGGHAGGGAAPRIGSGTAPHIGGGSSPIQIGRSAPPVHAPTTDPIQIGRSAPAVHAPISRPMPQRNQPISQNFNAPGPRVGSGIQVNRPAGTRLDGARQPNAASLNRMRDQLSELNRVGTDNYLGHGRDFSIGHGITPGGGTIRPDGGGTDILPNVRPNSPITPIRPGMGTIHPERPERPNGNLRPNSPITPINPVRPGGGDGPVRPDRPETPIRPNHPDGPENPVVPVRPDGPVGSVRPVIPVRPDGPVGSVRPDDPARPENPIHPLGPRVPVPPPVVDNHYRISDHHVDHVHITDIQNHFGGYKQYWTHDWYHRHPYAWRPVIVIPPRAWWMRPAWASVWEWCYFNNNLPEIEPIQYNYGDNIVYEGDTVYVNEQPYLDTTQYFNEGAALAAEGAETETSSLFNLDDSSELPDMNDPSQQWMPLGTFAVLNDPEDKQSEIILQIAVNKKGVVRGNLYSQKLDKLQPVEGAVDEKTQRVAFRIVGDKERFLECGLWNLTQETLPLLFHKGKNEAVTLTLIRLNDPQRESSDLFQSAEK